MRLYIPKDRLPLEARENTLKKVMETLPRFSEKGLPLLVPEEDYEGVVFIHSFFILSLS